jgi:penicillin-binding protein 1A
LAYGHPDTIDVVVATTNTPSKGYEPRHLPRSRRAKKAPKGGGKKPLFKRWWFWALLSPVILGLLGIGTLAIAYARIELPKTLPPIQTSYLYDRNGTFLTTLHGTVDRTIIGLDEMSPHLREAVLAVEDHDFYEHRGFDPIGIVRAAYTDLIRNDTVQGASTITQQLVKNVYAGEYKEDPETGLADYVVPPRTVKEKIREVLLAVKLEQELSKDQILAKYLNTVYFGHGAYGIEAAALTYFDKNASELTVLESATLAGVISQPEDYDPIDEEFNNEFRRDYALEQMARYGYLDPERAAKLVDAECCSIPKSVRKGSNERIVSKYDSEYFVEHARRELFRRYGSAAVYGGGLRITTTLDLDLQRAAEDAVDAYLPDPDDPDAALVSIDPRNGEILAMVGGRNWSRNKVNLATLPCDGCGRQAGSAFKPFTLAEAMEQDYDLDALWSGPYTLTIDDPICRDEFGEPWTPTNAEGSGTYPLKLATAHSVNTIFAQLVVQLGPENVADMAHRLGIRSKLPPNCSITLGSVAINPLEMTNSYATLAARGVRHRATPLRRIKTHSGRRYDDLKAVAEAQTKTAMEQNDADLVTYALQEVVRGGTGTAASLGARPVAGKTGSSQDNVDAWFCGYTPQLATCVWVGYQRAEIPLVNVNGVSTVYGGTIPAAIWQDYMTVALAGVPFAEFPTPSFEGYEEGPEEPVYVPPPAPSPEPTPSEKPSPTPRPEPSPPPPPDPGEQPAVLPGSTLARSRARPSPGRPPPLG